MQEETAIDLLRKRLLELQKKRDDIILEKGLAAEENKDLRENFAYDYWQQKELNITYRIRTLMKEIDELAKQKK